MTTHTAAAPPRVSDASVDTLEDEPLSGRLPTDDAARFVVLKHPLRGHLQVDSDTGAWTYTPHADVFGRPRYGGEFPCGILPGDGYEWLEVELTLTPCDGQPLTGAVRFMHPGPRSSEA